MSAADEQTLQAYLAAFSIFLRKSSSFFIASSADCLLYSISSDILQLFFINLSIDYIILLLHTRVLRSMSTGMTAIIMAIILAVPSFPPRAYTRAL